MTLPETPQAFADATWDDIFPYYDELAGRPFDGGTVNRWLHDWSALEELLREAQAQARIAYTADTADPIKEASNLRFSSDIGPRMQEQQVRLSRRLVESGYTRGDLETLIRRFRNQMELFREANIPLAAELQKLNAQYQKVTGSMTVSWDGQEKTVPQLRPFLASPDRAIRERAFRLTYGPYIEQRDRLAGLFDEQLALRAQVARNAGFENYRDFAHRERDRFDYMPRDCERFHHAVEEAIVPALLRMLERRQRRMGLDTLRFWDLEADPDGRPPLKPFDNVSSFIEPAARIFQRVDAAFGRYFQTMADERLLDLESRKGKAPGGYCATLPHRKRPFIFMNAAGVGQDVRTLLHESGHAFHSFEASTQPLIFQRHSGSEMAELASMSMELLAAPYLEASEGGYYSTAEAARARSEHLESILLLLTHIASVDAFQHWIYTSSESADRDARDAAWLRIRDRFQPGLDWSGLTDERAARWYFQLHIFLHPFYYFEYGLAQLGALQVWRNSLQDPAEAVQRYRSALALGGTKPLPELYRAAGARLIFDPAPMGELVTLVEEQLARFLD